MNVKIFSIAVCLLLFLVVSHFAAAKQYSPKIVPDGWVDDFDYQSSPEQYLQQQYQKGEKDGKQVYVYFYSDHSLHCRKIRRLMKDQRVRDTFLGAHIVMLDYFKYSDLVKATTQEETEDWHWHPSIIQVKQTGKLSKNIIFPDIHLHHRNLLKKGAKRKASISVKHSGYYRKTPYIRAMKRYFEKGD